MGEYHYLISGLPDISFNGSYPPYTCLEFKDILAEYLTKADAILLEIFLLDIDNKNLLEQLKHPDYDSIDGGMFTADELLAFVTEVQIELDGKKKEKNSEYDDILEHEIIRIENKKKCLPAYFKNFSRMYLDSVRNDEEIIIPWEDRLTALYYEYAMKLSNKFVVSWFELNQNINNIFTALTCRKYKLDREKYIVGKTEISNKLRSSNAYDFDLEETLVNLLPSVFQIAEDSDFLQRKWKTDFLKWEWLDEQVFDKVFDVESVLTYWLKLGMLEYWSGLNKGDGKKAFRLLVDSMINSSVHNLEEFKRNYTKL